MKFILTREVGRLAKWLRILGFDAEYFTEGPTGSLIVQALRDERIILTRNHRLPKTKGIKIVVISAEKIKEQLAEVLRELKIKPDSKKMFSRCTLCNAGLAEIGKDRVKDKVPAYVFATQKNFLICPECGRIYWQGTHWGNVQDIVRKLGELGS